MMGLGSVLLGLALGLLGCARASAAPSSSSSSCVVVSNVGGQDVRLEVLGVLLACLRSWRSALVFVGAGVSALTLAFSLPSLRGRSHHLWQRVLHADRLPTPKAYGANTIRARAVPHGAAFLEPPDVVSALVAPPPGPPAPTCGSASPGAADVTASNLRVSLSADGRLSYARVSDGKALLAESRPRTLAPADASVPVKGFLAAELDFAAVDGERVYGLGQHKTGILDYKEYGQQLTLAPANTEILIPVAHSSLGYAFLFNHPGFGTVQFNATASRWTADALKQIDFLVMTTADGPDHAASPWAQLQSAYVDATGHAPLYPDWTSGFWQCKNRYHNQSQIMDVAEGYISRSYPISLIIIDYYSWSPLPLGDEALPPECWPDPKVMVDSLKEKGVELMISPYFHSVVSNSKNYPGALEKGFLVKDASGKPVTVYDGAGLYDLFQPGAREYAFAAVERGYITPYGLHHWWLDCDEPCGGTPSSFIYNNGTWPAAFVGAAYPHMIDQMVYEGMGAPGKQYANDNVMLGRSAWAGSQRYGGAVWSGDTSSTFRDLNQQFRAGLNMVMSGIPYWTTDIGGYGGGNISSPLFRELIVRWFQWGAFCPLFRNHGHRTGGLSQEGGNPACGGTGSSNEIWNFGNASETAIARVMRLREQLRPYVTAQYEAVAANGTPVMRPLFFDFWEDEGAQGVDDELMFGPDYLVAPQLNQGAESRSVYLPKLGGGAVWRNVFTNEVHNTSLAGVNVTEPTPLEGGGFGTFPLYAREMPAPYPPPPQPPKCDDSCTQAFSNSTDAVSLREIGSVNSSSPQACCEQCKKTAKCESFSWGLHDYNKGPETCFFLSGVTSVGLKQGRTYGCVRPPSP